MFIDNFGKLPKELLCLCGLNVVFFPFARAADIIFLTRLGNKFDFNLAIFQNVKIFPQISLQDCKIKPIKQHTKQ